MGSKPLGVSRLSLQTSLIIWRYRPFFEHRKKQFWMYFKRYKVSLHGIDLNALEVTKGAWVAGGTKCLHPRLRNEKRSRLKRLNFHNYQPDKQDAAS